MALVVIHAESVELGAEIADADAERDPSSG